MNLNPFIGQYLKVIVQDQEWFIGELLITTFNETDSPTEFEFNILQSSKKYKGVHRLKADEILEIEELDPRVQQGIRLTLLASVDIKAIHKSMVGQDLPRQISFGQIQDPE